MQRTSSNDRFRHLGGDLALDHRVRGLWEDADLRIGAAGQRTAGHTRRDLARVVGLDNLTQALIHRLKTRRGELAALGHPEYGSRHHELIGEPNTERVRNLVKLRVLQALRREPRVVEVLRLDVRAEHDPPRESVRIEAELRVLDHPDPLALVVPFSFAGVSTTGDTAADSTRSTR